MKGNEELIQTLNSLLADELTAINQYMVHSEMCENWGYGNLYMNKRKQAMDEMNYAEWLIERILFFDNAPSISKHNPLGIGKTIAEIVNHDYKLELVTIHTYNEAIKFAREVEDQGTVDLLTKILKMEEGHVEWAEIQQTQMEQMGMENYLVTQINNRAS